MLEKELSFNVKRVFTIRAPSGAQRGGHGHKKCQLILNCPHGSVEVVINDGSGRSAATLDKSSKAIFLAPQDWHLLNFLEESVLVVLASEKLYNAEDYSYDEP